MKYFGFVISKHFLLSLNFNFKATYLIVQTLYTLVFFYTFILQQGNLKKEILQLNKLVLVFINNNYDGKYRPSSSCHRKSIPSHRKGRPDDVTVTPTKCLLRILPVTHHREAQSSRALNFRTNGMLFKVFAEN